MRHRFRCYYCQHEEERESSIPPCCKTCRVWMELDVEPPKPEPNSDDGEQLGLFGGGEA